MLLHFKCDRHTQLSNVASAEAEDEVVSVGDTLNSAITVRVAGAVGARAVTARWTRWAGDGGVSTIGDDFKALAGERVTEDGAEGVVVLTGRRLVVGEDQWVGEVGLGVDADGVVGDGWVGATLNFVVRVDGVSGELARGAGRVIVGVAVEPDREGAEVVNEDRAGGSKGAGQSQESDGSGVLHFCGWCCLGRGGSMN